MNWTRQCAAVIPCLNEAREITRVVKAVRQFVPMVFVIDDGSQDDTGVIARKAGAEVIRNTVPRGKGAALQIGWRQALERGFNWVLTMDGDGQHLASDIPAILEAHRRYPGSIVIGARLLEREQQPRGRRRANAVADWGISWACGRPVADTQSGQRLYPRAALDLVDLPAENFVFEAALLITACRERGIGVVSVPVASRYEGEFRLSPFQPVRDVTRITVYTVGRIFHYGHVMACYRSSRATPTIVATAPGTRDTH